MHLKADITEPERWLRQASVGRLLCLLCVVAVAGCTVVGPRSISSGRLAYNDAIANTNSEQLLMAIVRNRYQEDVSLLAVSSVTANVKMRTSGAVEIGVGDLNAYEGNLVPLSAGGYYEENPTISYVPVSSQTYIQSLASPVSVGSLARLSVALHDPSLLLGLLVASINGIYNPDFLHEGVEQDPRFNQVLTVLRVLGQSQRLHWVETDEHGEAFAIVITDYVDGYLPAVDELMDLLSIDASTHSAEDVLMPVSLAVHGREAGAIGLTTRSVMRLVEIFSAAVELPEGDAPRAQAYPSLGPLADGLRIRHAGKKPDDAMLAVRFRGHWFYIDDRDQISKKYFRMLAALWSVVISEGASGTSAAPVLTVPVGG